MVVKNEFVAVSGVRLFTQKLQLDGEEWNAAKPVIIFLHEGRGSVAQWKDFPQKFLEKCRIPILLYDRLGYGNPLSAKKSADSIISILKKSYSASLSENFR